MQLNDLVKPIDDMSDEELLERLREIRHRREVARPAAAARRDRAETKASRVRVSSSTSKLEKLLAALSPEELAKLLANNTETSND